MRIFGVAHAAGQVRAAPEIDKIEPALKRKQRVEQDQRARHGLFAKEIIHVGKVGDAADARFRLRDWLALDTPTNQGRDGADDKDPESNALGVENIEERAEVDL